MKTMSPGSREVSSPARSPGLVITGPDVVFTLTPIASPRMYESVVLPSPGGPENSTWSSGSPRSFAALTARSILSRTFAWPTNPSKSVGRSLLSNAVDLFSSSLLRSACI